MRHESIRTFRPVEQIRVMDGFLAVMTSRRRLMQRRTLRRQPGNHP